MNDLEKIFGKVRENDSSTKTSQICANLFVPMEFRVYLAMKVDCIESYDLYKNQSLQITLKVEKKREYPRLACDEKKLDCWWWIWCICFTRV